MAVVISEELAESIIAYKCGDPDRLFSIVEGVKTALKSSREYSNQLPKVPDPMTGNDQGYVIFPLGNAGMLRDWFAGQALANSSICEGESAAYDAGEAYKYADRMMDEREKGIRSRGLGDGT